MYSADETGKLAETILILHTAMQTLQRHHTIVQNEPDVSRLLRGRTAENLSNKLAGKRRYLASDVRLITVRNWTKLSFGKLRTRLGGIWSVGKGPFAARLVKFRAVTTKRSINNLAKEENRNRTAGNDRVVASVHINGLIQRECNVIWVKSTVRAAIPDSNGSLSEACH
jgi:hypothetical protein